jgi:peroxiredoxin
MRPAMLLLLCACGGAAAPGNPTTPGRPRAAVKQTAPTTPLLQPLWADQSAVIVFCADSLLPALQRRLGEFEAAGAWVAAVSAEPPDRTRTLAASLKLAFPLLSDPAGAAARDWSACDGGIATGFVVAPGGRIVYRGRADVDELLDAVKK